MDVIATLGPIVAAIVEGVRRMLKNPVKVPSWMWMALAMILGLIVTYGGDLKPSLPIGDPDWNKAITGIGVGAMASFVYKGADLITTSSKALQVKFGISKKG